MRFLNVTSNAELYQYLNESGCEIRSLGTTEGGFEMLCAIAGGRLEPPILITAGSHADELGGVYAALRLVRELESDYRLYIVPARDPFGFEGYRANLRFALGQEATIETDDDVYKLLRNYGQILYKEKTFVLAVVGEFAAAYDLGNNYDTSGVARRLQHVVRDNPALAAPLAAAKRVVIPWNLPMPRFGDRFKQAARGLVVSSDGYVGNFNRLFDSPSPPKEIEYIRRLVDELQPGLVLDLHEGYGSSFYVFQGTSVKDLELRISTAMTMAVQARGACIATPEELEPYWGERSRTEREYLGNGAFNPGNYETSSFRGYQKAETISFTLETGALNPLEWRADMHVWAACAAVNAYEENGSHRSNAISHS